MVRISLKTMLVSSSLIFGAAAVALPAAAFADPMVGGAPMYASKNIVQNAINSKDHTTLVSAVKAAGLVDTLEGPGPFTVFAPTNEAFDKLPPGTVDNLMKPDNKAKLASILKYHVVPGSLTTRELREKIRDGHGEAKLKTVDGSTLTAKEHDGKIELIGANGSHGYITIPNVKQSNGEIQVINGVLLPS